MKDRKSGKEFKADEKAEIYKQIEVVYDGPEGKVLRPMTEETSCFLGRGTRWCTASTESENMFSHYNKQGPLYVILTNDGRKFQLQLERNQLMNERDEEVGVDTFMNSYPWVFSKAFTLDAEDVTKNGYVIQYIKSPSEEIQLAAVSQDGWAIQFIENPSEKVQLAAVKQNGYAIQYIKNPSEEIQLAAVKQNRYAIKYIRNPCKEAQIAAEWEK